MSGTNVDFVEKTILEKPPVQNANVGKISEGYLISRHLL